MGGGADTLWDGNLRDVVVSEVWSQSIVPIDHVRALLSYWTQPPNPDSGYVEWWPSYTTTLGFNVVIESVSGPQGALLLDHVSRQGYARGPVTMSLRIVSRAE